jgi:hypothetical protein
MKQFLYFSILLIALILAGCNGTVTPPDDGARYYLEGALVKNIDSGNLDISVVLKENGTVLANAVINVGTDTLNYAAGEYSFSYASPGDLPTGDYILKVAVPTDDFSDTVSFTVPGDFIITDLTGVPDNRDYRTVDIASLLWSVSLEAIGYIYGFVETDQKYIGGGYSEFVESGFTSATINKEEIVFPEVATDTTRYHVYVYSYHNSPVPGNLLPSVMPDGLANSIAKTDLAGKFGTIVIAPRDSLNAVTQ